MADEVRNYWWLNAKPAIWSFSDFAPGEENNYTQFNENGSPRQVPKYFPMVRPGDLVLGYVTSPQKELVCLCEITRPLENGEFHYKKLLDFPNPVPASAWTSDPLLTYFHFQGSLFKLSQEQWDGFIRLVKERNPGLSIPQGNQYKISVPRIWKISHGNQEFNTAIKVREYLEANQLVTVNQYTGKGQGEKFKDEIRIGDFFYLRENGRIKFFGRFESAADFAPNLVNAWFHGSHGEWIARRYSIVFMPISDAPYTGPKKVWTPNYNSTVGYVAPTDLEEFERLILMPFFGKELGDISAFQDVTHSQSREVAMSHSLNTILYGPPGTGKTHDVVNHVLEIIDGESASGKQTAEQYATAKVRFDELKAEGRVAFATFHQSYGYEDFIEGIRPNTDLLKEGDSGDIQYKIEKGVFRKFCERAEENWLASRKTKAEISAEERAKRCIDELLEEELSKESETVRRRFRTVNGTEFFLVDANGTHVIICLPDNPTWRMVLLSRDELLRIVASGQRFEKPKDVHDFLGKVAPRAHDSYLFALGQVLQQRTATMQAPVENVPLLPYVFVIDEINRGNISKIFGELITLVEAGKRLGAAEETRAVLPYSGEEFGVPPNVYILGTMNTADRSIALLDTALRRRFDFVEMMPRPELLRGLKVVDAKGKDTGIDLEKLLAAMNGRIEFLLDREHTIGHAYFLGGGAEGGTVSMAEVADIFRFKIVPLLQEYFFEDYAKIRLVLGDASYKRKVPGFQFVTEKKGLAKELFPGVPEDFGGPVNGERALYRINGGAFDRAEAYLGIYRPVAGGAAEGPEDGE